MMSAEMSLFNFSTHQAKPEKCNDRKGDGKEHEESWNGKEWIIFIIMRWNGRNHSAVRKFFLQLYRLLFVGFFSHTAFRDVFWG